MRERVVKMHKYNYNQHYPTFTRYDTQNSEREQCVIIDGFRSTYKPVTSGVPQGSILGPILFVLMINDLPKGVDTNISLCADDTKIWHQITCYADTV